MTMRLVKPVRLLVLLAGVALLAGLTLAAGLPAVLRAFGVLGFGGFALVILIHVPLIVLMGVAWWSIGRDRGRGPLMPFVEARLVRDSVAELLPFSQLGGFAAGVRLLSLAGVPSRAAGFSLLVDLLMEFLGKLLYTAAGLALLMRLRQGATLPSWLPAALGVLLAASLVLLRFRDLPLRVLSRLAGRWMDDAAQALRSGLAPNRLVPSGVLHAVCWVLGGIEAFVTLRLMGIAVTVPEALAVDSLAMGLRTFGFWVPAALGVQEAAYVLACGLFGLGPQVAITLSLVRRARDMLLGCAGLAVWQGMEWTRARGVPLLDLEGTQEP